MSQTKISEEKAKKVRAWLQFAIDLEDRGLQFYRECLANTHHARAMELFDYLVRVETAHKKILEEVLAAQAGDDPDLIHQSIHDFMRLDVEHPLFDKKTLEKMTDRNTPLHSMFNKALKFEKEGLEFYQKLEKEEMEPELKQLFKKLADDELVHFKEIKLLGEFVFGGPVAESM